jgi:hypothetical protein
MPPVSGTTTDDGVRVVGEEVGSSPGARGRVRRRGTCRSERLDTVVVSMPVDMVSPDTAPYDARDALVGGQPPGTQVWRVSCPGRPDRLVVVPPRDPASTGADAARRFVEVVELPPTLLRANPGARGVVGIESWFWVEGYDGSPLTAAFSHFDGTVEVVVTLVLDAVTWSFGDATSAPGDLGRAYPATSSVRHAYQRASGPTPYEVTATLVFSAAFSLNGAAPTALGTVTRRLTTTHAVVEAEAVRTR